MAKYAFTGDPNLYSFPISGRSILIAPVSTPLPTAVTPITETGVPGWLSFGVLENSDVTITLNISTQSINTGVLNVERRKYITGQSGVVSATLEFFEPYRASKAYGADLPVDTASTSLSRNIRDLWYGGALGALQSLLIYEDFDINLVEDDNGGRTYEQVWYYSPRTQKDGNIDLSKRINKQPAIALDFALLGYSYNSKSVLLQQRWLQI